jgi:hypothetical protein
MGRGKPKDLTRRRCDGDEATFFDVHSSPCFARPLLTVFTFFTVLYLYSYLYYVGVFVVVVLFDSTLCDAFPFLDAT